MADMHGIVQASNTETQKQLWINGDGGIWGEPTTRQFIIT